jgi:hypothetical protein
VLNKFYLPFFISGVVAECPLHILEISGLNAVSHVANFLISLSIIAFRCWVWVIILCLGNMTHVFRTNTALEFGHEKKWWEVWRDSVKLTHACSCSRLKRSGLSIFALKVFRFLYKCNTTKECMLQNLCVKTISFERHVCFDVVS